MPLFILVVCGIPALICNGAIFLMQYLELTIGQGMFAWITCGILAKLVYVYMSEESIDVGRLSILGPFSLLWAVGELVIKGCCKPNEVKSS